MYINKSSAYLVLNHKAILEVHAGRLFSPATALSLGQARVDLYFLASAAGARRQRQITARPPGRAYSTHAGCTR